MGLLGGLLGAVGGLLGFAGQESANDAQMAMLERQIEWQKEVLQNKVQWNVQDLRNAGLNPVLAAMSPASGGAPSASAPQVGNVGQAAVNSALSFASIAKMFGDLNNQSRQTDANVSAASARESKDRAEADLTRSYQFWGLPQAEVNLKTSSARQQQQQVLFLQENIKKIDQDIAESQARVQQIIAQLGVYDAQIANIRAQTQTEVTRQQLNRVISARNDAERSLANSRKRVSDLEATGQEFVNELKRFDVEFFRKNPEMGTYEGRRRYYKNSGVNLHGPGGFGFGFTY